MLSLQNHSCACKCIATPDLGLPALIGCMTWASKPSLRKTTLIIKRAPKPKPTTATAPPTSPIAPLRSSWSLFSQEQIWLRRGFIANANSESTTSPPAPEPAPVTFSPDEVVNLSAEKLVVYVEGKMEIWEGLVDACSRGRLICRWFFWTVPLAQNFSAHRTLM